MLWKRLQLVLCRKQYSTSDIGLELASVLSVHSLQAGAAMESSVCVCVCVCVCVFKEH